MLGQELYKYSKFTINEVVPSLEVIANFGLKSFCFWSDSLF